MVNSSENSKLKNGSIPNVEIISDGFNDSESNTQRGFLIQYIYQFLPLVITLGIQLFAGKQYTIFEYIKTALLVILVDICAVMGAAVVNGNKYHAAYPLLLVILGILIYSIETSAALTNGGWREYLFDAVSVGLVILSIGIKVKSLK